MTVLPLDWNEWRSLWTEWLAAHPELEPRSKAFPGKNFLADEILGTFFVYGRTVELSEVVFPNLEDRDERGNLLRGDKRRIGITFAEGEDTRNGVVVSSFEELERELGLAPRGYGQGAGATG